MAVKQSGPLFSDIFRSDNTNNALVLLILYRAVLTIVHSWS